MFSKKSVGTLLASLVGMAAAEDAKCNLWQTCESNADVNPDQKIMRFGACTDPSKVTEPTFQYSYDPAVMSFAGQSALSSACPYLDLTQPLCCNQDNAQIMSKSRN